LMIKNVTSFRKTLASHFKGRGRVSVFLAGIIFATTLLSACSARGIPGSMLLTPVDQRATLTATPPTSAQTIDAGTTSSDQITPTRRKTPSITASVTTSPTETIEPTITLTPTKTRYPTKTYPPTRTRRPSKTPTITLTPVPPQAYLRIAKPGPLSKVGSPIRIEMGLTPGDDGMLYVDLIGEDGRYITREVADYRNFINKQIYTAHEVPFEIPGAAETARLILSVRDRYGRTIALSSVDLVLIQLGDNIINPEAFAQEPFLIRSPKTDDIISGGVLHLSAVARPLNNNPLIIELINETGGAIASKILQVEPPTGELSHTPFEVDIPYQVSSSTKVRLTIHQVSNSRLPGIIALNSIALTLLP
jgi:hypothetical protein